MKVKLSDLKLQTLSRDQMRSIAAGAGVKPNLAECASKCSPYDGVVYSCFINSYDNPGPCTCPAPGGVCTLTLVA